MVFKILFSTTYILVSNRRLDTWIEWEIAKTMTRRVGILLPLYSGWSTRGCKKKTDKKRFLTVSQSQNYVKKYSEKSACIYITLLVFILWWENFIGVWFNLLQIQMYEASHLPYTWYRKPILNLISFPFFVLVVKFWHTI